MKKNMKKILATSGLVGTMLATTLTGCKNEDKEITDSQIKIENSDLGNSYHESHAEEGIITYRKDGKIIKRVVQCVFKDNHQARYESITSPQLSVVCTNENGIDYFEIYEEEKLQFCNNISLAINFGGEDYTYDTAFEFESTYANVDANSEEYAHLSLLTYTTPDGELEYRLVAPDDKISTYMHRSNFLEESFDLVQVYRGIDYKGIVNPEIGATIGYNENGEVINTILTYNASLNEKENKFYNNVECYVDEKIFNGLKSLPYINSYDLEQNLNSQIKTSYSSSSLAILNCSLSDGTNKSYLVEMLYTDRVAVTIKGITNPDICILGVLNTSNEMSYTSIGLEKITNIQIIDDYESLINLFAEKTKRQTGRDDVKIYEIWNAGYISVEEIEDAEQILNDHPKIGRKLK